MDSFFYSTRGLMTKKYYWLKLKNDFFKSRPMKKLRKVAGGDTYTIIYLKLQLLSLQNNGTLEFEGVEENLLEELALDIDESIENVQTTMFFLEKCGLVTDINSESVSLPEVKENTGSEASTAGRVRKHREKKKQLALQESEGQKVLQCNSSVTKCNTEIEKEKELELKLEKERELKLELEYIYSLYPRKKNKQAALKAIEKSLKAKTYAELVLIVTQYATSVKGKDPQYIPYPATWFNGSRWEDEEDQKFTKHGKPQLAVNKLTQEDKDGLLF